MRESLGLSQQALADELGASFTSVNRWENEQQRPSPLALKALIVFYQGKGIDTALLQAALSEDGEQV